MSFLRQFFAKMPPKMKNGRTEEQLAVGADGGGGGGRGGRGWKVGENRVVCVAPSNIFSVRRNTNDISGR